MFVRIFSVYDVELALVAPHSYHSKPCPQQILHQHLFHLSSSWLAVILCRSSELLMILDRGDNLHPRSNVEKMSAGIPLTDGDREPWLAMIRAAVEQKTRAQWHTIVTGSVEETPRLGVVATCSALKGYYRDILRGKVTIPPIHDDDEDEDEDLGGDEELDALKDILKLSTFFVYIDGSRELMEDRISKRTGHFMKASMLDSQLKALESPIGEEGVVGVALGDSTAGQVATAIAGLKKYGVAIDA
ncbi:hypothetical protein BDN72DRAFT_844215 [Pluteus cervinus]|uniref:Uncharacterized protein n=1 Tax=Pluteus cervinus TaxID=181527 RepID=A0ACD3AL90_9AGAR|nr:hypothetical protein BDN72DRAFT_844215 [Pluteus cervinus]